MIDFKAKLAEYGPRVLPLAAVFAVGAGLGWFLKPDQVRVEEKLKVVEVEKQVIVKEESVRVEVVKVKDSQFAKKVHREKTTETRPDGTVVVKETEDQNVDKVVKEKENSTEVKVVEVTKEVVVEKEKVVEKLVEPVKAQWHVGILAGLQPQFLPVPAVGPFVFGAEVEHRFIGPIFLGVWGTANTSFSSMQAGAKLGLEF